MNGTQLTEWLAQQLPTLDALASLEFTQPDHEELFERVGWHIGREAWYPETSFEIHFSDVQRQLVALYDEGHQEIGIGLYALTNPHEPHEYILESITEYHCAFDRMLAVVKQQVPSTPTTGTYRYLDHEIEYKYANWDYDSASLILVQHHEGDVHLAHEASLDIRVRPKGSFPQAKDQFPLVTNMLF